MIEAVGVELSPTWEHIFKIALNVIFSLILSVFIYFDTLEVIIGIKPASGNHESNIKRVVSILCGFNTMGTDRSTPAFIVELILLTQSYLS